MNEGWSEVALEDVCRITSKLCDPREDEYLDHLHVGGANIESKTGSLIELKTAREEGLKSGKFPFDESMVLYSKIRPYLEKVARPTFQGLCSADIYPLTPNDGVLSRDFLFHLLLTPNFTDFAVEGSGRAGMPKVNRKHLFSYKFSIPSLPEQKKIVGGLDKAFAAIDQAKANIEQNIANAKELFQSKLSQIFSQEGEEWEEKTLKDVCKITSKLCDPRKVENLESLHVGGANIESTTGLLIELKTAREEGLKSGKFPFDESMVLYSKIRPYLEKVARPDFRGLCSADIYPLRPSDGVLLRDFLFHLLLSRNFTDYAIEGSGRAGMPKVNRMHLFSYSFSLPPFSEQERISNQLDALSESSHQLEAYYHTKLASLDELKKSILQKAFEGELT